MKRLAIAALGITLSVGIASTASAQFQKNRFSVTTRVGAVTPERAASVNTGGVVGLDTEYGFSRYFSVGATFDAMRSNTHGEDFLVRLRYGSPATGGGDTVFYQYASQPVNTFMFGLAAFGRLPIGRATPFVMGGIGNYTMLLDTQVSGAPRRRNDVAYTAGAGLTLRVSNSTGIQFDVRSVMQQGYSRTFLDPTLGRNKNTVFPEDFPAIPAAKNTAQNTVFTLGFRYIP